jgi:hypothetical protein
MVGKTFCNGYFLSQENITMQIGPTGKYPLGPINPQDRGGISVAFAIIQADRLGVMHFGTALSWLAAPPIQMRAIADNIRTRCIAVFGDLPYDKSTLPIKVFANQEKGIIELRLPQTAEILAANPEMWLALAEVIDERSNELLT